MIKVNKDNCTIKGIAIDIMAEAAMVVIKAKKAISAPLPEEKRKLVCSSYDRVIIRALIEDYSSKDKDLDIKKYVTELFETE